MGVLPFEDIRALIAGLPAKGPPSIEPAPALGRLGEVAAWLSCWRAGPGAPHVRRPILALYAGSHAVASHSSAAGAQGDVRARLEAVAAGEAPANGAARSMGAGLEAFDLAVDRPVPDITSGPAMSERECAATMAFGMEVLAKQPDLLLLGDVSAGGDIAAAAVAHRLFGGEAGEWIGEDEDLVAQAGARAALQMGRSTDPLEVLRQLGGRETAALAGAMLGARTQGIPVIIGGYPAAAAAAVLQRIDPRAVEHVLAGDGGSKAGHRAVLEELGLEPLTRYGLVGEDGLGALAGLATVRLACEVVA